ncbi:alpha/beta hydrolase [Micromonospora sp. NPDC002296]|uniref:alpha/beta fold hydrolase n=1 Tax=Micromonospora sp. NPDC002296 TaxID=3154271 RepID=UPI0033316239
MLSTTTQRSVDVDGIPVGYHVTGEGPGSELVLVHGGTGHPETSFASLLEHFTRHRRAIVPGYSGSNLTPLPPGEVTVDMLVDQVAGVLEASAKGPADIFGISTGAVVAAALAGKRPDLVRRAVLLGGFEHFRRPWQRLLMRTWLSLAKLDGNAFAEFTLLHVVSDTFIDSMSAGERLRLRSGLLPSEGLIALLELISRLDISEHVRNIRCPTLVVGMRQDQLVPVRYAREFRDAIAGSEYVELDCGHAAAMEKPAELLKTIEEFLA